MTLRETGLIRNTKEEKNKNTSFIFLSGFAKGKMIRGRDHVWLKENTKEKASNVNEFISISAMSTISCLTKDQTD